MAAPQYQVMIPPGAPVPGVGFVRHGEQFTAPPDFVPSMTFIPINDEAVVELKKVKQNLLDRAADLKKKLGDTSLTNDEKASARQLLSSLEDNAQAVRLTIPTAAPEAPAIRPGIPLSELGKGQDGGDGPPGDRTSTPDPKGKGSRAADK
jgi:hypothetical protein